MKLLSKNNFKNYIKDTYLETILPRFKEERIQAFLTLATTLIAISIFSFFAINPTLTTIAQLKKQLADSQYVDQKLVNKISAVSALQQEYIQIQNTLPNIMDAIPEKPDIPLFTAQVQAIAQTNNITLSTINTLPVELTSADPTNGYLSFSFLIDAQGSISNVTNFLNSLQSYNRLVTINGITLTQNTLSKNLSQETIRGNVFFKKK